ncbi:MAG TPA: hypothetical protein VHB21_08940 [Minicystis sp.]|nr:hypothetical protein [Minicystis sp.]
MRPRSYPAARRRAHLASGCVPLIENTGDIETFSQTDPVKVGDTVSLVFRADDEAEPPFNIRIKSPTGKVIVERVLRELPTGMPQSAPPVTFTASGDGEDRIEIKQLYGKQKGEAVLHVLP